MSVDDETLVNGVVLKRQAGGLLYRSADGQAVFQFTQAQTFGDFFVCRPALTPDICGP